MKSLDDGYMKKIALFSNGRFTFELAALFVFVLILVANLAVVRFNEGYFKYFGIPMNEVNYVPQVYDYVKVALPVIIASVIVTMITLGLIGLSMLTGALLAKLAKPGPKTISIFNKHREFFEKVVGIFGVLIGVGISMACLWVLSGTLYSIPFNLGQQTAKHPEGMTSISQPSENLQKIIIHKGDNELILKSYDQQKKKFIPGYEVMNGNNYTAMPIRL